MKFHYYKIAALMLVGMGLVTNLVTAFPSKPQNTFSCISNGRVYDYLPPCATPPCADYVTTKGHCCPHCPNVSTDEPPNNYSCVSETGLIYPYHPACAPPPCDNYFTTEGHCCPHCPNVEPPSNFSCVAETGRTYHYPIPCLLPQCADYVHTEGHCCPHCPIHFPVQSPNWTCLTEWGENYHYQTPCATPSCADFAHTKGNCCSHCPNGPNCRAPTGELVKLNDWYVLGIQVCQCRESIDMNVPIRLMCSLPLIG